LSYLQKFFNNTYYKFSIIENVKIINILIKTIFFYSIFILSHILQASVFSLPLTFIRISITSKYNLLQSFSTNNCRKCLLWSSLYLILHTKKKRSLTL